MHVYNACGIYVHRMTLAIGGDIWACFLYLGAHVQLHPARHAAQRRPRPMSSGFFPPQKVNKAISYLHSQIDMKFFQIASWIDSRTVLLMLIIHVLVIGFKLHHGFTHTCLWFQIVSRIPSRTVFNAVVHILVIGFKLHHGYF